MSPAGVYARPVVPAYRAFRRNQLVYDGPSQLTGDRILVLATANNANRKIGEMVQLWIIPSIDPIVAMRSGDDTAVCGDCALRGDGTGRERTCYVEYWRAVSNIWQGHTRAERSSPEAFAILARGLRLRIGAYGDPVAVPHVVWAPMLETAANWTAYTHQWRWAPAEYRRWCMASVDGPDEQRLAVARGWRTFRVRQPDGIVPTELEVVCPHERDQAVQCDRCSLCQGTAKPAKSIVVTVHGNGAKWFRTRELAEASA